MSGAAIRYFDREAKTLAPLYESTKFHVVHSYLLDFLPDGPADVLDIGAGSGRDAAALAGLGYAVTVAEPSAAMLSEAKALHRSANVRWLMDGLPRLETLQGEKFDLILLSAVWMYVDRRFRTESIRRLRELIKPLGIVALSIRELEPTEAGDFRLSDLATTERAFLDAGFQCRERLEKPDSLGRSNKAWTILVYQANPETQRTDNSV